MGLGGPIDYGRQKVLSVKAIFHGFRFHYPRIDKALGAIIGRPVSPRPPATTITLRCQRSQRCMTG